MDIVFPTLSLVISLVALVTSFKACELSDASNKIAEKSNSIARDANVISKEASMLVTEANTISIESNRISKNANELTAKAFTDSALKANEANGIAKQSDEIAEKSLLQSEKALAESLKYAEINSQIMWNTLKEAYDNADREVLEWEKANDFLRAKQPVDTLEKLMNFLDQLKISDEGKRLYIKRYDKRMSLIKASEAYEPFKERLTKLDLTVPTAPLLPVYLLDEKGRMILDEKRRPIRTR